MKTKLRELGEIITGNTPSKQVSEFWDSPDIPFVKPDSIDESGINTISSTNEYISDAARPKARIVSQDAVFVTCIGSIGKIGIAAQGEYAFNQQINVIIPNEKVRPKFLAYALLASKARLGAIANAPVVPIINKSQFGDFEICIPESIHSQIVISEILDKTTEIIKSRKLELQYLDDLIKDRFVEMFRNTNCLRVPLDNLALGKGEYGAQSASEPYDPNRPRYVRITDINDDGTLNNDCVSSSNREDDGRYKLYYGDFLFARMGATVGKTYAYKSGNQIFAGYLIRYKLNLEKILPEYLFAYTKTDEYLNWVLLNQSGAAQPGINAKKYGSLQIPTASIEKQKEFVAFVAQIDKTKSVIQKSLEETQMLFDSLMQQYFG